MMNFRLHFRIAIRYLARHPWQSALMLVGIALGVAVAVAVDLANASASRAFDLSTESVTGKATHLVAGGPTGMDEQVYVALRRAGLPASLAPVVSAYASSAELGGELIQLLGVDPFAESPFRSYIGVAGGEQAADSLENLVSFLSLPGGVLISTDLAGRYGLQAGDPLTLTIEGRNFSGIIAGVVQPADDLARQAMDNLLLVDLATAQELTGRLGVIDRIDVIAADSAAQEAVANLLPANTRLLPVAARSGSIAEMTAAFRVNLTALSLLALVVGLFLIYNTMTFSVVQRRPLFGTLRALGMSRQGVFGLVLGEALIIGVLGAGLGTLLGVLMGQGAVRLVTRTINDLFFVVSVQGVQIPPESLLKGMLLGVLATALSAAPPAWEAASVPPRAAMSRSGLESKARRAIGLVALGGGVVFALGVAVLALPTENLVLSFGGTFAVVIGFAMLAPLITVLLARLALPISGWLWGALGRMAPRNVINSLSRTGVAVAALMVAVSVTIGVSLMVGSFRSTVVIWLGQVLQGDVYVTAPVVLANQTSAPIDPQVLAALEDWPGVEAVYTLRAVVVDSPAGPINIAATNGQGGASSHLFLDPAVDEAALQPQMAAGGVIISEPLARRLDLLANGAQIELFTDRGLHAFPVLAVYYDYGSTQGTVMMNLEVYRQFWQDPAITSAALMLAPSQDPNAVAAEVRSRFSQVQLLEARPNQVLRAEVLEIFDRTFAITSALQLLATIVAFIGVLSALLSLELERQRELGILRAVGLTARQLWGLVMLETGLLGSVAGLLSLPTGFVLSYILINIINKRSFGWTLQMEVVPEPFVQAMILAVLAALLAGIYPAYRMGRMITAEAMRYE
jgi:putative ABC transport system permease protein